MKTVYSSCLYHSNDNKNQIKNYSNGNGIGLVTQVSIDLYCAVFFIYLVYKVIFKNILQRINNQKVIYII